MPRRIEVELTSQRDDGTWTWRAAGARQPKGTLTGTLLYKGASVGDVVRADAEFHVDGIDIISVLPPKGERREPERIELKAPTLKDDQLVTSTLAPKGKGGRGEGRGGRRGEGRDRDSGRGDRRPRSDSKPGEGRPRSDRPRGEGRPEGGATREGAPRRERRPRNAPPPVPEKPKPKRLRPQRHHRAAVLADLPESERPIAEQVLRGGVPAVRQAVEKQNEEATKQGQPTIPADQLVAMAERLLPRLRTAEWRDRADAALANIDELDLRDLRSVVVAADSAARDDETRELAATLRDALNRRVEEEHRAWLTELHETMAAGRTVRALRLSSRPPKAGAPLPADMAAKLAEAASAAFGGEVTQERWATVLDAVAYSPVRQSVVPAAYPAEPSDELLSAVRKLASRVPTIAAHFGIEPTDAPRKGRRGGGQKPKVPAPPKHTAAPPAETPAADAPATEPTPAADSPVAEAPAADAAPATETTAPAEASAVASDVAEAIEEAATEETAPTASEPAPEETTAQVPTTPPAEAAAEDAVQEQADAETTTDDSAPTPPEAGDQAKD